jgi:hypothetical protein
MTLPSMVFGLLCALLVGAIFHIVVDGGLGRLVLYLVLSIAGFGTGAWIASSRSWVVLPIGPLDVGAATIGSLVFLGLGYWLSLVRVQTTDPKDKV